MDTNKNINASEANLHAIDYWQVLKNRYGMIILTFILVLLTAAVITYVMPKMYQSTVVVQINPYGKKTNTLGVNDSTQGMMTRQFFQTQFSIIKSEETLKGAIEEMQLARKWGVTESQAITALLGVVDTRQERGTDLIEVSVRHRKREEVKTIAEAVVKAYDRRRRENIENTRNEVITKYKQKIEAQEDKVEDNRARLYKLSKSLGIPYHGISSQTASTYDQDRKANSAEEIYDSAKRERDQLEILVKDLQDLDDKRLVTRILASARSEASILRDDDTKLKDLISSRDNMKASGLGSNHPRISAISSAIISTDKQLTESVRLTREKLGSDLITMNKRLESLKKDEIAQSSSQMSAAEDHTQFGKVKDEYEREFNVLQSIKSAEFGETIVAGLEIDPLQYHKYASEPAAEEYVSPKWVLNMALGAVAGLIFGIGIAFALEFMDTSVKSLEDVERYLQVPVLAVIPRDVGVLHKQAGASPDAEAYRILRTNIEFNRKNPDDNAITVVSGGAGEGKSTTLVNLAYICAQGGYSTLMIDADLRRPRLHTFFDINNTVGLTNYLTTDLMLEDVILQTPVDNLFFMPSGILPADAAGILNSRRMSEMVQDVKQRFDLVLIDSPPILGVSDASVLASEVDLTMIVVQHRKLPRNMLIRVKQAVENVGGTVLGVVLNNVDVRSDSQYQYYTSYYTYYAPSELDREKTSSNAMEANNPAPEVTNENNNDDLY